MINKLIGNQITRYIFIGGFSYLVEMGCLFGLHDGLKLNATLSVAISFWVGFIVAYVLQKFITFKNTDRSRQAVTNQLLGYSLLVGWNYLFTLIVVGLLDQFVSVFILRTLVVLVTTVWNYVIYKKLFKNVEYKNGSKA